MSAAPSLTLSSVRGEVSIAATPEQLSAYLVAWLRRGLKDREACAQVVVTLHQPGPGCDHEHGGKP